MYEYMGTSLEAIAFRHWHPELTSTITRADLMIQLWIQQLTSGIGKVSLAC